MSYQDYLKQAKSNKMTAHFTLFDVCNSQTALSKGIDNTPSPQTIVNARLVLEKILEPLCSHFKTRPDVSCIFRSKALNKCVGGASDSQHLFGQAVDFTIVGVALINIVEYISKNLEFDQLILEPSWVHCSFSSSKNRQEVLKNVNGKYINI